VELSSSGTLRLVECYEEQPCLVATIIFKAVTPCLGDLHFRVEASAVTLHGCLVARGYGEMKTSLSDFSFFWGESFKNRS
jgi:hypothetical protein